MEESHGADAVWPGRTYLRQLKFLGDVLKNLSIEIRSSRCTGHCKVCVLYTDEVVTVNLSYESGVCGDIYLSKHCEFWVEMNS